MANQILDEERRSPSISYKDTFEDRADVVGIMVVLYGPLYMNSLRSRRPREIQEDPNRFSFKSKNYNLLLALVLRLAEDDRQQFIRKVLIRLVQQPGCKKGSEYGHFPSWNYLTSELPLIAEFGIRNGATQFLLNMLGEARPLPGHAILLRQLEDMIALNFTVLGDAEYVACSLSVANFAATSKRLLEDYEKQRITTVQFPGLGSLDMRPVLLEIIDAAGGIQVQCEKARYLYLKGYLEEGLNLETNQDKDHVEHYLQQFGFSKTLVECLNKADQLYHGAADAFELKSSMAHLRSFMENLHIEAGPSLQKITGVPFTPGWGPSVHYLLQTGTFSGAEEQFAVSLFRLISDEAVHPLVAEREYARLTRNVVIEYALLFLRKLEKLGVHRR
ncbi:MAG: hypothetical protein ABSE93_01015 [Terriglobia bacterium]|jgi:hypothetical protein